MTIFETISRYYYGHSLLVISTIWIMRYGQMVMGPAGSGKVRVRCFTIILS